MDLSYGSSSVTTYKQDSVRILWSRGHVLPEIFERTTVVSHQSLLTVLKTLRVFNLETKQLCDSTNY